MTPNTLAQMSAKTEFIAGGLSPVRTGRLG
jgi:hypothetical protein